MGKREVMKWAKKQWGNRARVFRMEPKSLNAKRNPCRVGYVRFYSGVGLMEIMGVGPTWKIALKEAEWKTKMVKKGEMNR